MKRKHFPKIFFVITRIIFTPLGSFTGLYLIDFLLKLIPKLTELPSILQLCIYIVSALFFSGLFFFIGPLICAYIYNISKSISELFKSFSSQEVICGSLGLIAGLFTASLVCNIFNSLENYGLKIALSIILYLILGILGLIMGGIYLKNIIKSDTPSIDSVPKILDSSAIIDGRILFVAKTGFLTGPLVIPNFILSELRQVADSADLLKRNRGRRGLDIIKELQTLDNIAVKIDETIVDEIDTDAKLLKLASLIKGVVLTTDYNLSKVASVRKIVVLNINDLSNAIKPVAIPGEKLFLTIIKAGKEVGQGVAFLEDGTMIVIENGGDFIGQTVEITITTSLQTSAGRIIFGRIL